MVKAVTCRKAKEYQTSDGASPFSDWVTSIKDARTRVKITKVITQMEAGNFGDHKSITDGHGLHERRIDHGPGYRIYYITEGDKLIIIFAGSDKSTQQPTINLAKKYADDYRARKDQENVKSENNKPKHTKTNKRKRG